jgi:hypothetical protein
MPKKLQNKKAFDYKSYARYSSMFFQMAVIIGGGVWGGYWLDQLVKWEFPVFIVLCSFISIVAAIYYVVRDL